MRARVGLAIFLAGLAAVMAVAFLIPVPSYSAELHAEPGAQGTPVRIPVPDCGEALCVVPLLVLKEEDLRVQRMAVEIAQLRTELAEAKKTKTVKCGTVERTS